MLESTSSLLEFLSALRTRESISRSNLHRDGRASSDPESKTDFVVHDTGEAVYFVADEHGKVTVAALNDAGQEFHVTRVQKHP
jgi:hypothetical protein